MPIGNAEVRHSMPKFLDRITGIERRSGQRRRRADAVGGLPARCRRRGQAGRRQHAYGRPILDRLATLEHTYDPVNLFRHAKSVSG
jgi:hypothetical protein